jgi:ParB family chromosome partitioning protein
MAKRKSLGRGLDALLSPAAERPPPTEATVGGETDLRELPIDLLSRGRFQPRLDMREESLAELAESIRAQGVVQPIIVRPVPGRDERSETRYEIVAGERRWRAAQLAGLEKVPTIVKDLPDKAALAIGLIENIQRENLNPIEEASSLKRLIEEFDMTHAEAAEAVGRSRVAVSNLLRLLELPPPVRKQLEERGLNMGHARAILGLPTAAEQIELARRAAAGGWSVRQTESAVRKIVAGRAASRPAERGSGSRDPDIVRLETELSDRLGAEVHLEYSAKGGRLVIRYHSLDELEGILEHIN